MCASAAVCVRVRVRWQRGWRASGWVAAPGKSSPSCATSLALNDRQSPRGAASSGVALSGACSCCRCVEPKNLQGCWRDVEGCARGAARLISDVEAMSMECIFTKETGTSELALLSHQQDGL